MRFVKWAAVALVCVFVAGCAGACQTCRGQSVSPTPQASPQHPAPLPPVAPHSPEPPAMGSPPAPAPGLVPPATSTPAQTQGNGRVRETVTTTTQRDYEGAVINNSGTLIFQSPGVAAPPASAVPNVAHMAYPVPTAAMSPAPPNQSPAIVPVAVAVLSNPTVWSRIGKAGYVLMTGNCPPPPTPKLQAVQYVQATTATTQAAAMFPASYSFAAVPTSVPGVSMFPVPVAPVKTEPSRIRRFFRGG